MNYAAQLNLSHASLDKTTHALAADAAVTDAAAAVTCYKQRRRR